VLAAWIFVVAAWVALAGGRCRAEIGPTAFTQDDPTTGAPRMSQSPSGQLVRDGDGLAFAFWEDNGDATPDSPSRVWFQRWTLEDGWQTRERLDQSRTGDDREIGGRHPALQPLANGDLLAVWYDYRHCTQAESWNDNIEVYGDRRAAGGSFGETDIRLTASNAAHNGDNSYVAKTARLADGRVAMVWYDFYWDRDLSDIALRVSDVTGAFGTPPAMEAARITDGTDRAAGDAGKAFTMPQIAADTSGTLHIAWTTGTNDVPASLYYGRYDPDAMNWIDGPRRIAQGVRGHLDPPKLAASADGTAVWLAYVDRVAHGNDELYLRRHLSAAADWEAPIRITDGAGSQQYIAHAVDSLGRVRFAYVDRTAGRMGCAVFDPETAAATTIAGGFESVSGDFVRPAIALDGDDYSYVVWEERTSLTAGRLWFWSDAAVVTGVADWLMY
jgi:hypothetical protein